MAGESNSVQVGGSREEDVANWVMTRIRGFSKVLGMSLDGLEEAAMKLLEFLRIMWRYFEG